jgi:hypothetical protein
LLKLPSRRHRLACRVSKNRSEEVQQSWQVAVVIPEFTSTHIMSCGQPSEFLVHGHRHARRHQRPSWHLRSGQAQRRLEG